jgi:hypothetical protein
MQNRRAGKSTLARTAFGFHTRAGQHLRRERARRGDSVPIVVHVRGNGGTVVKKYELLSKQFRIIGAGCATKVCELTQDERARLITDTLHLVTRIRVRARS